MKLQSPELAFQEQRFREKVDDALQVVKRILDLHRNPQLAGEVDHSYGDKYSLVDQMTNMAVIGQVNALARLGLTAHVLQLMDKSKSVTLRFQASESCVFLKQQIVEAPATKSVETDEIYKSVIGPSVLGTIKQVVYRVKEYHWTVNVNWAISVYIGTKDEDKIILSSRSSSMILVTQSHNGAPLPRNREFKPSDVSLNWLMKNIDTDAMASTFHVDTQSPETKTPRRNPQVEDAVSFMRDLSSWTRGVRAYFNICVQQDIMDKHNPVCPVPRGNPDERLTRLCDDTFVPVQPLFEDGEKGSTHIDVDSTLPTESILSLPPQRDNEEDAHGSLVLLSTDDMYKFLKEQVRTLNARLDMLGRTYPASSQADKVISVAEASLVLISLHCERIVSSYTGGVGYVEQMLEDQLVSAIGKRIDVSDIDQFLRYHNARLLHPPPQPFCYAIRQPEHYPCGILSIEGVQNDGKRNPVETLVREVDSVPSIKLKLNAATCVELTGKVFLHGWIQHRFGINRVVPELIARARQFSSFMLVVGTMSGSDQMDPKDAIILQNKDELIIPLILDEIPTAKEFKDAIRSMSPEQQRFAQAFRKMQLGSSVLGISVIQIKPQLEALLGLPCGALTKEMKLTQDLMELFVEYQVPSDLLSYDGNDSSAGRNEKVDNVRSHVDAVSGVIDEATAKALKEQSMKAESYFLSYSRTREHNEAPSTEPFKHIDQLLSNKFGHTAADPSCRPLKRLPFDCRTLEQKARDVEEILSWKLHPGENESPETEPFKRIDQLLPEKPGQSPQDRANDIDKILQWMRNRGVDDPMFKDEPFNPTKPMAMPDHRTPEHKAKDIDDILQWVRNPRDNASPSTEPFKRIDQLLPKKVGQIPEDRAKDIYTALTWVRNRGVDQAIEDFVAVVPSCRSLKRLPFDCRTLEQKARDVEEILSWKLHPGENESPETEPFKRIDQLLPEKPGQSPQDRANDIENVLQWMRNRGVDDPMFKDEPFNPTKPMAMPDQRTPEQKAKDIDDILQWVRNPRDNASPSTEPFKRIDQLLPKKVGQTPEDRAKDIDTALTWVRNRGVDQAIEDFVAVVPSCRPLKRLPFDRRTLEQKARDVEEILSWKLHPGENESPETEPFKRIDQLLPEKPGQSPQDRANEIDNVLQWMRNRGVDDPMFEVEPFKSFKGLSMPDHRTLEQKAKDVDAVLQWVQNPRDGDCPSTEPFKRIDQLLPKKVGQIPEDRAKDIDTALTWVRNRGVDKATAEDAFRPLMGRPLKGRPIDRRIPHQIARDISISTVDSLISAAPQSGDPAVPADYAAPEQPKQFATYSENLAAAPTPDGAMDFAAVPRILDTAIEQYAQGAALRSTTITLSDSWIRNRQDNLLAKAPTKSSLRPDDLKQERNKAMDLLDALSRSGSLPISFSELHVIVSVIHCFEKDVIETIIQDNINPIEKLENSTLLVGSVIHGVPNR